MILDQLEIRIGYTFRNKELLRQALTHTTYVNEHQGEDFKDNQRLEFLGDSVLNAAVTRSLYRAFPDEREGSLTKMRAELISEPSLARVARRIDLGKYLYLGRGEELDDGRDKSSILADAYESLIGAIFLDSSFDEVFTVIDNQINETLGSLDQITYTDYKSALLEYCQSKLKCTPQIVIVEENGPEHDKTFVADVVLNDTVIGSGQGKNKKQAAQMACRESLRSLGYPLS
ncbi:MAG: ribonuclease III [Deltaproteobacteria bacterium]|nr:ribonuclease III [Deltaproteobacteria bacterium]